MHQHLLQRSLVLLGTLFCICSAYAVTEPFDNGLGVWEKGTYYSQLEYRATGGNPGGYMMFHGSDRIGLATKSVPYVGDYASAGYDEITVDLNVQLMPIVGPKPEVMIRAGAAVAGWAYTLTTFTPQGGVWQHFAVPMNANWSDAEAVAAGWVRDTGTEISFADTMRSVWNVGVRLKYVLTTAAFIGVDNFSVHKKSQPPAITTPRKMIEPRAPTLTPRIPLEKPTP